MLIGELSRRSGFSRDTIRFYEKVGLIRADRTIRRTNNYKDYPEAALTRLRYTQPLKKLGFTLKEITALLDQFEQSTTPCRHLPDQLTEKLTRLDAQIAELQRHQEQIRKVLTVCDGTCTDVSVSSLCL